MQTSLSKNMSSVLSSIVCVLWISAFLQVSFVHASRGYYRYPAIYGQTIVFVAEGDLWTVGTEGGIARRLTSHPGAETRPHISPDGSTIAFAAQYEGPTELYTMPIQGGAPQRRTVEAEPSVPVAWTPGGKLVYSTRHYSTLPAIQLVTIDLPSGKRSRVPLSQASDATYDAEGTIYFVRPRFHRQQVKRYQGGTARNIWKFPRDAEEASILTNNIAGECHSPWWYQRRIYFVTDTDGTMNIWSMSTQGEELRQHTKHSGWDVKSPSLHDGRMVYQVGADLWLLDIETGVYRALPITLASDFDQLREKWITKPMDELTSAHLHPKGTAIVLTARGRLFVAPVKDGRLVRASRKKGVRFRDACFMPDGESILTLSDDSDEFEFWKMSARGVGDASQLTKDGTILKWRGYPSPDSKYIAYSDKNHDLWVVEVDSSQQTLITKGREGIRDIVWSPDSRWLVFGQVASNTYEQIKLYHLETKVTTELTSDRVNSTGPTWSPDGNWLYFLSDRGLTSVVGSPWGPRQPEPYFDKPMKIYRLALRRGLRSPFQVNDELGNVDADGEEGDSKSKAQESDVDHDENEQDAQDTNESNDGADDTEDENQDVDPIEIDLDNIQRRVKPLPVPRGNYSKLSSNESRLFWLDRESGADEKTHLVVLPINNEKEKPKQIAADLEHYELSANGEKLLVQKDDKLFVTDAKVTEDDKLPENEVDLSSWRFTIDVREDCRQIFVDAWRMHRDYFYDPGMHGLNWIAVRQKYEPLVDRVTSRSELSDLIGQMVAELSVLHTAVRGGDVRESPDQVQLPTLGARLGRDENAGGYRIDYIYQSDPDYPAELSPLADPDLDVKVGDIVEAINGEAVLSCFDPHLLLREHQDEQVLLKIGRGDKEESREIIVKPTNDEATLRHRDWEYTRRLRVEKQGDGKLAYVHLKAMGSTNLTDWYRNFYPVFDRQGLIIDVRHNRGGNIDSIILEKLLRRAWFYWKARVGQPFWNMQYAFRGHMVVLCDEHTASDGEAFTEGFRRLGLGKIIGTRTWGGEIWLTASNKLSDGGIATAAEFGVYGPEPEWLIEGYGVEPDIVVDNLPHATFKGDDAQLDAAIKHLKLLIEAEPRLVPEPPKYPDKSFDYP